MSECKEPRQPPIGLRNEQSKMEKCGFEALVRPEADREVTVTRIQKAVTVVEVEAAAVMLTHDDVTTLDVLSMEDSENYFGVCLTAQTVSFSICIIAPITVCPPALVQAQLVLRTLGLRSSPNRRVRASFKITTIPALKFAHRLCPSSFDRWFETPKVLRALPPGPGAASVVESDGEENYEFGARVGSEEDREGAVTRTQKAVTVAEVEAAALTSTHHGVTTLKMFFLWKTSKKTSGCV